MSGPKRLRVLAIRHGQAAGNAAGEFIGSRNDELTERGVEQATRLADVLSRISITAIYTSPLKRALATAETIATACNVPLFREERLKEQNFGDWEGLTVGHAPQAGMTGACWNELDVTQRPPNGESLAEVRARVWSFVEEITVRYEGGVLVIVSHVGPIKSLVSSVLGIPLDTASRMFLDTGTVSIVDLKPSCLVRMFNGFPSEFWPADLRA